MKVKQIHHTSALPLSREKYLFFLGEYFKPERDSKTSTTTLQT